MHALVPTPSPDRFLVAAYTRIDTIIRLPQIATTIRQALMAQSTTGDASLQKQLKIESEEKHSPFPEPTDNQIWQNAIQQYYSELRKGGIKGPSIDRDLWKIETPSDLLEEIRTIEPPDSKISRIWIGSLRRLEPVLLGLNDFTAVTAWALGMNGRVAAVIWGSIRLLLNVSDQIVDQASCSLIILKACSACSA